MLRGVFLWFFVLRVLWFNCSLVFCGFVFLRLCGFVCVCVCVVWFVFSFGVRCVSFVCFRVVQCVYFCFFF